MPLLPAINYRWCCCYQRKIICWCYGIDKNMKQGLITTVSMTPANNLSLVATTPAIIYHWKQ
jgi:hypothetical protein